MMPDGTKDSYAYFNGTWNPTTNVFSVYSGGGARQILVFHGQSSAGSGSVAVSSWNGWTMDPIHLVPNLSTVTEIIIDAHGRVVFTGENIYANSTIERIAAQASTYNGNNLLSTQKDLLRSVSGGDVATTFQYEAGLLKTKTDIDGMQTTWGYDAYLRNTTVKTGAGGTGSYPEKTQTFAYYSSNLKNTAAECDCSPTVTTYTYETTGRLASISESKPGATGTLSTVYSYPSARQTTVTLPTGATKTTILYLDGRVKEQGGTGQPNVQYVYDADGTHFITHTRHGTTNTNGWAKDYTDWLGRTAMQRSPQVGWVSNSTNAARKTFNYSTSTGRLTSISTIDESTSAPLVPEHRYDYGLLGLLTKEGADVGNNGALDDGSMDRITRYSTTYLKETSGYAGWVREEKAEVLRTDNNASNTATVMNRRTRLTRFNGGSLYNGSSRVLSEVVDTDSSGRATTMRIFADPATRMRTQEVVAAGASQNAQSIWQNGYLKSEQSVSGVTRTHTYNTQGLLAKTTEGTTNAALSYTYHSGTNYVATVVQTIGASTTATTSYAYTWDTTAKSLTVKTTDAAANVAYAEQNAMGLPWRSWGTAVEPALTGYDTYGRRTGLTTWRSGTFTGTTWPSSPPAGDATSWTLDAATGAVKNKHYPGGSSVAFTYNARGQVKTRTWARTPTVTTTYSYFDSGVAPFTGELKQVSYSDGTTPTVSYTYTRFGALASVTDAAGTRNFAYRSDLKPTTETLGTFYGSRVLTSNYDALGRPTGYSFNGSSTVSATVGYDATTGRPATVAGALGSTTASFTLGYATGTDWVSSVTSGSYNRTTPLVSRYDVLASATTKWGTTTLGGFTATYTDARGWRKEQTIGTSSYTTALNFGAAVTATYGYDGRGRLTSSASTLAGRNLTWTYDQAGNRLTEADTATTTYTANALNQYTAITGQRAEPGIAYDSDGNLIQDGTWTYAYDGENRLKSLTKSTQTITFAYDHAGRRIRKTVTGTGAYDIKFLWTGWKLAAELASNGTTVNKTFIWGRDFSDAQGNAGGAGSLLAQISGTTVSYAVPDALGNIVAYANSSGAIVAAVEYSPYGKGLSATGSWQSYPIGFSGQYMDWEPGLVYYGLRYYAPKHGRFINRDPIEEAGGNNLYAFVNSAPTRGWDVLGLERFCWKDQVWHWYDLLSGIWKEVERCVEIPDAPDKPPQGPGNADQSGPGSGGTDAGPAPSEPAPSAPNKADLSKLPGSSQLRKGLADGTYKPKLTSESFIPDKEVSLPGTFGFGKAHGDGRGFLDSPSDGTPGRTSRISASVGYSGDSFFVTPSFRIDQSTHTRWWGLTSVTATGVPSSMSGYSVNTGDGVSLGLAYSGSNPLAPYVVNPGTGNPNNIRMQAAVSLDFSTGMLTGTYGRSMFPAASSPSDFSLVRGNF